MNPFQKILSFFDPLFGTTMHIHSWKVYEEPIEIGHTLFPRSFSVEWRYFLSDRLARRETIFHSSDGFFYRESGQRWIVPSGFYAALKEFEYFLDRAEEPLRKERFEQILNGEE